MISGTREFAIFELGFGKWYIKKLRSVKDGGKIYRECISSGIVDVAKVTQNKRYHFHVPVPDKLPERKSNSR